MTTAKKQLGSITILLNEREKNSQKLNLLLTKNSHLIMARLGINIQPKCVSDCTGLITLNVQGSRKEIDDLAKQISGLKGTAVKTSMITK